MARRHLRWLLCFALLLPVAQWASVAHAFTHAADAGGRSAPEPGTHLQHCPVCPAAAAVAAGGLACGSAGLAEALRAAAAAVAPPAPAAPKVLARRPANRGPPALLA
ncbi:MAG: hypothetical protein ACXWC6_06275 [Ramlibacter sp.]